MKSILSQVTIFTMIAVGVLFYRIILSTGIVKK